jgi:hypothetical protein
MASKHDMTMPPRDGRRSEPKVKPEDPSYARWRQDLIYAIYGNQEEPIRTKRGRAV